MWSLLLVTLPIQPNAVRLRIWRALKALGCAALRDDAGLLPPSQVAALDALADKVRSHGGTASVLCLAPRDAIQRAEWLALFERSDTYAHWCETVAALQQALPKLAGSASSGSCMRPTTACLPPGPEAQQLATCIGWLMHRTGLAWPPPGYCRAFLEPAG